jgi:primosomal protein N' (replication factor Y)
MRYVDVILPLPLEGTFTYALGEEHSSRCGVGMRVLVPFGKSKTYAAVAVRLHDDPPQLADDKVRTVLAVLDDAPVLLPQQLRLVQWVSTYYMAPLGDICKAALPAGLKAETGYKPRPRPMCGWQTNIVRRRPCMSPSTCCTRCRASSRPS